MIKIYNTTNKLPKKLFLTTIRLKKVFYSFHKMYKMHNPKFSINDLVYYITIEINNQHLMQSVFTIFKNQLKLNFISVS